MLRCWVGTPPVHPPANTRSHTTYRDQPPPPPSSPHSSARDVRATTRYKPLWTALHKHTEALVATGMLDESAEEDDAAEGGDKGG